MSGPGAVFGRPAQSKIRATYGGNDNSISHIAAEVTLNINASENKKAKSSDLKTRLIQYEIAEKEACKVMSTICKDASTMFKITWNESDIHDLLSGVLVLGNLCKRIGYEKNEAELRTEEIRKEMVIMEKNKVEIVSNGVIV